jgi:glycosyltransferase involved in cell wall biosynthesis
MTATVIIPTTGSAELIEAVKSVLDQTYDTNVYVVCDGADYSYTVKNLMRWVEKHPKFLSNVKICNLPINVGANGFYGHRVYAAFTHLINTKYVLYLDQDNWFEPDHVQNCIDTIEKNNLDWSYSLRNIYTPDKEFIAKDDCESLGKWPVFSGDYRHIDTNCYCLKTEVAVKLAQVWHGGWGQDRVWFNALSQYFSKFDTTGKYTVNYRVGGNEGSVKKEFFEYGNKIMNDKYEGVFPWQKI